jgi:hypothetical protein
VDLDHAVGWLLDHGVVPASTEQLVTTVLARCRAARRAPRTRSAAPRSAARAVSLLVDPALEAVAGVRDPATTPATILRVLNTAQDLPPILSDLRDAPDGPEN